MYFMNQAEALSILKTGVNVFLTGEPGSGKTYTVNEYISYLRNHDIEPAITASTGIAATHIGGMTIHSWSGIGINKILSEEDLDKMGTNERLTKRVARAKVLIIDEISMLDAKTLHSVDTACKTLKRNKEPFGGLQVIFVGDFFQLPPVSKGAGEISQFAFLSESWKEAKPIICYLTEQHRHEDSEFIEFLSAVRRGDVGAKHHTQLIARKTEPKGAEIYTRLYSHNIDVDSVNTRKLNSLSGEIRTFVMEGAGSENLVANLKRGCLSPERLILKIGARVMFTKNNFEQNFFNGTLGEVESFDDSGAPIIRTVLGKRIALEKMEWSVTDGARTLASIRQIPLRLAWAITVHKSQGMTLDNAVIDLSNAFEFGQGYVALSRVRSFSGLFLLGYNSRALEVHPGVTSVDESFRNASNSAKNIFSKLSKKEYDEMRDNFIKACGGKLKKVTSDVKSKKLARAPRAHGKTTLDETLFFWNQNKTAEEIASIRGVVRGTILSHLTELYMKGFLTKADLEKNISPESKKAVKKILGVFKEVGFDKLAPVFDKLGKRYSYDDLRLIRLLYT